MVNRCVKSRLCCLGLPRVIPDIFLKTNTLRPSKVKKRSLAPSTGDFGTMDLPEKKPKEKISPQHPQHHLN